MPELPDPGALGLSGLDLGLSLGLGLVAQLLLLGAVAGFLAGLLGVGGGMMMVPFITAIVSQRGVPPMLAVKVAIATSMATILFTSLSSLRAHHRLGAVRWDLVRQLAPGIVAGGLLAGAGAFAALKGQGLALFFAVFIGWSSLNLWRDRKPKPGRALPGRAGLFGAGGVIGFLSGLLGAGGAFVAVPFMVWCNVPIRQAVGTAAAIGFPVALAATSGYVLAGWQLPPALPGLFGYLYLPALAVLVVASVSLAPLGARVAQRMDTRWLKRLFALLLLGLAGYMLRVGLGAAV